MKKLIMMLAAVVMLSGCAGHQIMSQNEMQIQRVVEVPNTPKGVMFDKSRMWYATAFNSANAVIQYENKENGTIMGNGVINSSIMITPCDIKFSVSTEVKDNKARITATGLSINVNHSGESAINRNMWEGFKGQIEEVVNSYDRYLKSSVANIKTDNW